MSGYDNWITKEPDDSFNVWGEYVDETFTDRFYNDNIDWIENFDGECNK